MSGWLRRRGRLLAAAALAGLLASPVARAGTLEQIDQAVKQIGAFVQRSIPDAEGSTLVVTPFLSDRLGRNILGDRLRSELELYLAGVYLKTRVQSPGPAPSGSAPAAPGPASEETGAQLGVYTVGGEVQSYPEVVRILCRLVRPDGSLGGGTRVDLPSTAELRQLLVTPQTAPPAAPAPD